MRTSLRVERGLLREHPDADAVLVGCDEVGRGAWAGPVAVGAVAINTGCSRPPTGVRDSKELAPEQRRRLVPRIRRWALASAVGWASSAEIDEFGLTTALGWAAARAVADLDLDRVDIVLLDGNHDYLSPALSLPHPPAVHTLIKGDQRCTTMAAASVVAKVARDDHMVQCAADVPEFDWASNKGYRSPRHLAALAEVGPSELHRTSWACVQPYLRDIHRSHSAS